MRQTSYNSLQFAPGDPGNITDVSGLLRYVRDLENRAAMAFAALAHVKLERIYAPPDRPRDGTLYLADGVQWNPGAGAGLYYYEAASSTYKFLG